MQFRRRWYVAYNMPRVGGKPQPAVAQVQVGGAEKDIAYVQRFLDAGIHVDLCWRDAGGSAEATWFPAGAGPFHEPGMAWLNSGTWEIDPAKYPNGFKPFTDWIHARNMQFVLWFEPERVGDPDSWLGKNHPEWLLPGTSHGALLDEGNPAARQWLIDHVSGLIKLQGIDYYPLTPYSRESNQWIAWQFSQPETGDGVVQAFRRAQSADEVARLRLRGLDPGAGYVFTNLDSGESQTLIGRELLDNGLAVSITGQPGSAVIVYRKAK